jgi:hypothetical protein
MTGPRANDPDDPTRVQGAPAGPASGAHGSTAVGPTATSGGTTGTDPATRVDPAASAERTTTDPLATDPGTAVDRTPTAQVDPHRGPSGPATPAGPSTRVLPAVTAPNGAPTDSGPGRPSGPPDRDRDRDQDRDRAPGGPGGPRASRKQVVAAQRERYGGISWGSAFFGWLSANGVAVLLTALLSAGGVVFGFTQGIDSADAAVDSAGSLGLGGGIALLALLFLAYLAGGYVAGRMARFDGVKQGVAVWLIGLLVILLLALAGVLFGAQYNVLSQLDLPRIPVDEGTLTTAALVALGAVLLATLVAAVLGGLLGVRYHRRVDKAGYEA